jgi:alpha-galactosidase
MDAMLADAERFQLLRGPTVTLTLAFLVLTSPGIAEDKPKPVSAPADDRKPVKVFILAGQSNMEGQGFIQADPRRNGGKGSLEFLVKDSATAAKYKHLMDKDGKWGVRDDVWVHYLGRKGKLTVGYGVKEDRIGPELGFGHVIGDAFEEPVLLIKLAWGGKSLAKDFRPPNSGGEVGPYYKEIVSRTKAVLKDLKKEFPEFGDRGYELAGFGWHQGWNDRVNQAFNDEYEKNLANFIRDIRKDLGVKSLPFVIAETGMSGSEEKHPRALSLMRAQAAVAKYEEFEGNVAFVGTKAFWRDQSVSPTGQAYHWNTNAETYYLIGEAMGIAMKKLCDAKLPAK